jgi:anti-anti-sigma regulatory factor
VHLNRLNTAAGEELRETELTDLQESKDRCSAPPASRPSEAIALICSNESSVLRLTGAIDIEAAAELRASLMKAFEEGRPIQVLAEGVTRLDLTALQLLWATRRLAASLGVEFAISAEPMKAVGSLVTELGMDGLGIFA